MANNTVANFPDADCTDAVDTDPSGIPFAELDPALLRAQRTSLKWTRFPADVLPLFVAEMDFTVAPEVQQALIERVQASDLGYLDGPGPLAPAFADFARDRWGWHVPLDQIYLATDVATGIVESIRVARPNGGRIALATPAYPSFFEMFEELPVEAVEIPLLSAAPGASPRLDLAAIEQEFERGIDIFLLCNPHNPHGLLHSAEDLTELARLAALHDVFVVSDEIHAPLTHRGQQFTPFAPIAAAAGALSVTTTSASKGWNLAGVKCSVIVAADDRANDILQALPPEVACRASILGLHASVAAFSDGRDWLDRTVAQIEANDALLAGLVQDQLPGVVYTRPRAGYLAWLDFGETRIAADPFTAILTEARVALNDGVHFGEGGAGHVRLNLACAPATIREAVRRIAAILPSSVSLPSRDSLPKPGSLPLAETSAS
ncbi:aminotransferase class I/II-fold pyridoxal phosphate-dependent enzyme [Leucobacter viscericola]|uniref:cysteine-S-conjugate beta-lyase n=1 Tax=Leucobacter viscericola TaxID=2714935 RepID=A0A6G7XH83_9MICO|nr:aminotransferase class I/II-fold pyridoxal phosphate-dependent enzyme [Leucobacter viscericola]QIK63872.1 aminotransferase class I/II-fold pyridoxal phosphate-dependent enzyme [Leucobacter viscericola]